MGKKNKVDYRGLLLISHIGYSIIAPILLGVFVGGFIDKKVGTDGIFMIIFIIICSVAGVMNIFKISNEFIKRK